jgi:hypothetical protein
MHYPTTHNIPFEQIENGALILWLLRECKTWEAGDLAHALRQGRPVRH